MRRHSGKSAAADDVMAALIESFKAGVTQDLAEFLGWLRHQAVPDASIYGDCVAHGTIAATEVRHIKLADGCENIKVVDHI